MDTIARESDRCRLLVQITQSLSSHFRLPHDFDLTMISLPTSPQNKIPEGLRDTCKELDQVDNQFSVLMISHGCRLSML